MKKRLLDNLISILLIITVIVCTVYLCKEIDKCNLLLYSIDYKMNNLPTYSLGSDIYEQLDYIQSDLDSIFSDVNVIQQDVDDIGYVL